MKIQGMVVASLLFIFSFSQTAMAAEKGLYVGAGINFLTSDLPVSANEAAFLADPWFGASRASDNRRIGKELVLGYQMNDSFAVEAGYIGGDSGATSTTTMSMPLGGGQSVSIYDTQKETLSTWHMSIVAQKPLNESFAVTGRLGMINVHTEREERLTYVWPANIGGNDGSYQGWSSASDKSAALFGLGLIAKVADKIDVRAEVLKSSALPSVLPKVDVVLHF